MDNANRAAIYVIGAAAMDVLGTTAGMRHAAFQALVFRAAQGAECEECDILNLCARFGRLLWGWSTGNEDLTFTLTFTPDLRPAH